MKEEIRNANGISVICVKEVGKDFPIEQRFISYYTINTISELESFIFGYTIYIKPMVMSRL